MTEALKKRLLVEAAELLCEDSTALPGPADVRREIRHAVYAHPEIPEIDRDRVMWQVWDLADEPWARRGWPEFRTVAGWAQWLRLVAGQGGAS